MEVYTIQMGQHRKAKELGIELIDTTVKTGIPAFAPTWDMVLKSKDGSLSHEDYTSMYRDMMLRSYMTNQTAWLGLLQKSKIAIACYCKAGDFCHRHLFIKYLEGVCKSRNIPFTNMGEIT
jgi:hypothetical protein